MRIFWILSFSFLLYTATSAQEKMTNDRLISIIGTMADSIGGSEGQWSFRVGDMWMVCMSDTTHNRMRIITPIIEVAEMEAGEMERCLKANFHTALDAKYCIADGILWSAFIHPLSPLTEDQVKDSIQQVFSASATFGTLYSSSELLFPGARKKKQKEKISRT